QQERHFEDRAALAEVLADALLLGEGIIRLGECRHGELHLWGHLWAARPRPRLNRRRRSGGESPVGSRWYCRHQHAFSRYFRLSTRVSFQVLKQRPKAGGFRPQPRLVARTAGDARTAYFTSTVAPAASRSFLNLSASSFVTPSLTAPPASVRSLASFRPRPVIARTTLMTSTFLSPGDFRLTVNSVCSSAAAAPPLAAGPAATATGAAADTPNFSSIALTSSITSTRVLLLIASMICSLERDIVITSLSKVGNSYRLETREPNWACLVPQAACCWPTALVTRATCEAGSANTRTSMVAGWTMTLSSIDSASSRVGSDARTSTWEPGYFCPPIATRRGFSLSFALANSLIRRPAAPGSSR